LVVHASFARLSSFVSCASSLSSFPPRFPPHPFFFFFPAPATTELYTLSLHDALPILAAEALRWRRPRRAARVRSYVARPAGDLRSEEHTSELQSRFDLVCRLLLEKKKTDQATASAVAAQSDSRN